MIFKYFTFALSIAVPSWILGMILTELVKRAGFYDKLANLNFLKNEKINKIIGIGIFKWIVKNTFFKYFNPKLKLKNKIELSELETLRKEMTFSEISHLLGFGAVSIFALVKLVNGNYMFALVIMLVNIVLNLYPSLLQQENKRRINQFLKRLERSGR